MSKVFYENLGSELKAIRIKNEMSQQTVADRLDISRSCLSGYELGTRIIGIDMVYKLCDIYNVDINEVLNPVRKYVYKK